MQHLSNCCERCIGKLAEGDGKVDKSGELGPKKSLMPPILYTELQQTVAQARPNQRCKQLLTEARRHTVQYSEVGEGIQAYVPRVQMGEISRLRDYY